MRVRKASLALLVGVGVAGLVGASAATLGGLTSTSLGAETSVVAGCDPNGIGVTWGTSYSVTPQGYVVNTVTLTGVDAACATKTGSVTLSGTAGAALTTQAFTAASTSTAITITTPPLATLVLGISVVIAG